MEGRTPRVVCLLTRFATRVHRSVSCLVEIVSFQPLYEISIALRIVLVCKGKRFSLTYHKAGPLAIHAAGSNRRRRLSTLCKCNSAGLLLVCLRRRERYGRQGKLSLFHRNSGSVSTALFRPVDKGSVFRAYMGPLPHQYRNNDDLSDQNNANELDTTSFAYRRP